MKILLPPGKYIVAVSGGIDSVVLLHMMRAEPSFELAAAHFDHGIRSDSGEDLAFVSALAEVCNIHFISGTARLGPDASEDTARRHRYAFLHNARLQYGALAIVTAHHQDDVIETALINIMRGTKRRGLVSLRSTDSIKRPLLDMTKEDIREYALKNNLEWHEDSTNLQMKYARNRIRAQLQKNLTEHKRREITKLLDTINANNMQIDSHLNEILQANTGSLQKEVIETADELVAAEIIAGWLRMHKAAFDKKTIERLITGARKLNNGAKIDIDKHYYCLLTKHEIVLTRRESV